MLIFLCVIAGPKKLHLFPRPFLVFVSGELILDSSIHHAPCFFYVLSFLFLTDSLAVLCSPPSRLIILPGIHEMDMMSILFPMYARNKLEQTLLSAIHIHSLEGPGRVARCFNYLYHE